MTTEVVTRRQFLKDFGKGSLSALTVYGGIPFFRLPRLLINHPARFPDQDYGLSEHLALIGPEQQRIAGILASLDYNLMAPLKNLTPSQVLENFLMYNPLYKAAELDPRYQIPGLILEVIHTQESTASADPKPDNPYHRGAMQLAVEHYSKPLIIEAPLGWEFLDELPQRYSAKLGYQTNDWEEILRAACLIRSSVGWATTLDEDGNEVLDPVEDEGRILQFVRRHYSAEVYGAQRVSKYLEIKTLLG